MHIDPTLSKQRDDDKTSRIGLRVGNGDLQGHDITRECARFQEFRAGSDNRGRYGSAGASRLAVPSAQTWGRLRTIDNLKALRASRDSTRSTHVARRRTEGWKIIRSRNGRLGAVSFHLLRRVGRTSFANAI